MQSRPPVFLLGLLLFLVVVDQFCILPLLHVIGQDLDFDTLELCLLVTAYHAAAGAFGLFLGPLIDRRRHGRVFLLGLFLFSTTSILTIVVGSFGVFILLRITAGLGASAIGIGISSYISTRVVSNRRRWANGRVMIGAVLGLVVGPLLCGIIATIQDWRWVYVYLSALTLPTIPIVATLVKPLPRPANHRRLVLARGYLSLILRVETGSGILVMFLFTGAVGGVMAILGLWLFRFFEVNLFDVSKVFFAGGLGVFAGGYLSNRLSKIFGLKRLVVASSLLLLGCFFVLFCIDEWVGAVYTAFFCTAMVESVRRGPLQGTLISMVKVREMPAYTTLKNGAGQAGMAVFVPIMGILFESNGTLELPLMLAVGLTLFATLAYLFFIRPPVRKSDPSA